MEGRVGKRIWQTCNYTHFTLKTDAITHNEIPPSGRSHRGGKWKMENWPRRAGWELMDQNYPRQKVLTRDDGIAFPPFLHPSLPSCLPCTSHVSIQNADREIHLQHRHCQRLAIYTHSSLCSCSCAWWRDKLIFFHATASILLKEYIKRR